MSHFQRFLIIIALFFSCSIAFATDEPAAGYWVQRDLWYPSQHGYACGPIYEAADFVLTAIEAREVSLICRVYNGASLSFSSLQTRPQTNSEEPVAAYWKPIRVTLVRDGESCSTVAEVINWLLSWVAVRNLQRTIFCDHDRGYLLYNFEALVPSPLGRGLRTSR